MTWLWKTTDRTTIEVESLDGDIHTLDWSDYGDDYPNANGWTYSGEYPDAVYNLVVENDVQAALMDDIERAE